MNRSEAANTRILKKLNETNWETICKLTDYIDYLEGLLDKNGIVFNPDFCLEADDE